jgi:hypothetical protein
VVTGDGIPLNKERDEHMSSSGTFALELAMGLFLALGLLRRGQLALGQCPSYFLSRLLHVGSMLPFMKYWVNYKILGLPFGSRGDARFGVVR